MLDALRKGAGTWVAKIFIGLLVMSFAIWGVADMFQNFGQNVAAKVGNTEISIYAFDRAYRRDLDQIGRQLGRPLSTTEGAQFGIPQQTLGRLVAEAAMSESATAMKLGISDEQLAREIQSDPSFQGASGRYDRNQLAQLLRASGITEDEYVIERRQLAERQQLADALAGGLSAPEAYLSAYHAYQNEARTVRYLALAPSTVGEIAPPTEDALATYFEDNKDSFKAPEYRDIAILELTPETLARPEDVAEEMLRDAYDRAGDRFKDVERRQVRQLSFTDPAEAAKVAADLSGGKTFEEVMIERNLTDNDVSLGLMAREDFLDAAIGDAVFAMAEPGVSGAVEGRFSTVIVDVTEIRAEAVRPFDEVKDQLRTEIAQDEAEREVLDLLDEIEDARAGGATLAEIGERFSVPVATPAAFDSTGLDMQSQTVALPDTPNFVSSVFSSDVGVENDPLELGARGFVWFEVSKVTPTRDRELNEVREAVIAAAIADTRVEKLQELSASAKDRLDKGETLEAVATDLGVEIATSEAFTRNDAPAALGREAVAAAFTGPEGTVLDTAGPDGARLVQVVASVSRPAFFAEAQDVAAISGQLSNQLQESLLGQYVADVESKAGVETNQAAISQVLGLTQNN